MFFTISAACSPRLRQQKRKQCPLRRLFPSFFSCLPLPVQKNGIVGWPHISTSTTTPRSRTMSLRRTCTTTKVTKSRSPMSRLPTSIAWGLLFVFFSIFVAVGLYAVGWSKDPVRITSAEPGSIKMSLFANWIVTGLAIPAMVVLNEGASAIMQAYGVRSLLSHKKGLNFKLVPFVFTYLSKLGKITNFAVLIPTRHHQTAHVIGFVTLFAFGFRFFVSPVTVQTLPSVDVINVNRINSFELGFTATSIPIGVGLGLTMGFLEAGPFFCTTLKSSTSRNLPPSSTPLLRRATTLLPCRSGRKS
ncbi:hypothetical protein BDZ88DRAFT_322536 [Geranomyces variabilis]|nr:hypothetical protein BDZ88DRAFT_322536 [Geranomyces variabilis]